MLYNIVQNKIGKIAKSNHEEDDDFDPNITLDNLIDEPSSKSPHKGNIQSVQLAAKMVKLFLSACYLRSLYKYT